MKKLILSTFAMSLMSLSFGSFAQIESVDDFLGLEQELLPDLQGEQRFTKPELHASTEMKVVPEDVIKDVSVPTKGQNFSIIPWSGLDPEEWMNITTWVEERKIKDVTPDWKIRLREDAHKELMGKVLQCKGKCENYRGVEKARVQHLSRILEGDELHTDQDTVAWVFMMDGSLLRISPNSSVSFQEINITKTEFFFLMRLNQGHAFWHPRNKEELPVETGPETDSYSLPLMIREANQQYFERKIFKKQNDREHLSEVMDLDDKAVEKQFASLAKMKTTHNSLMTLGTRVMMVSPNATLIGKDVSFDFVYTPGGVAYFKKRQNTPGEEFSLGLRGYTNTNSLTISDPVWFEVEAAGRTFNPSESVPGTLQILELLTKRIKTFELARECWIRDFTLPILRDVGDAKKLAENQGYRLWGEDQDKRAAFLSEYTRRIETTHLRTLENLLNKLQANGEKQNRELSEELYQKSLNSYLLGLKNRYDNKKMQVREMNDLQYYVWILKDGKF